ncbi:MAG: hypothetical protein ACO38N_06015 [Candidatus Nanopelagicales bacterium]
MRIFCLGTGRSGTTTFTRSLEHASNYTSGHESRASMLGSQRLDYPDWHAEADNRLTWMLGALGERFGDEPVYVHLSRDRDAVIDSFRERHRGRISILRSFGYGIISRREPYSDADWAEVAATYVDTVTANVDAFLRHRPRVVRMTVEDPLDGLAQVWDLGSVQGDFDAAAAEWSIRHNARPH